MFGIGLFYSILLLKLPLKNDNCAAVLVRASAPGRFSLVFNRHCLEGTREREGGNEGKT